MSTHEFSKNYITATLVILFLIVSLLLSSSYAKADSEMQLTQPNSPVYFFNPYALEALKESVVKITASFSQKTAEGKKQEFSYFAGAGVIIHPDGIILTSNHIITDSERVLYEITVETLRATSHKATILWQDTQLDLALIKIDVQNAPYVNVSKDLPKIGSRVIIIGHPFINFTWHISFANISHVARVINNPQLPLVEISGFINPGNSGGGAFNDKQELIGIIKSGLSAVKGMYIPTGIGFFVPIKFFCDAQPAYCAAPQ